MDSKILAVEDSEAIAEFYKDVLESEVHKVSIAIDGNEGLELYENEMEADHIKPWHDGGKTISENCQMLYKQDNRIKSGI